MAGISVAIEIDQALKKFHLLESEGAKAIARALNRTATTARAEGARQMVRAGYGIKISAIKKAVTIRRANRNELVATVKASGRPIPLINYKARQTKAGVTVTVLNGSKTIESAFIATMPTGHRGVFVRTGTAAERSAGAQGHSKITKGARRSYGKHGLPIRELFGPSVPAAFASTTVQQALATVISQRFGQVLDHELTYLASTIR